MSHMNTALHFHLMHRRTVIMVREIHKQQLSVLHLDCTSAHTTSLSITAPKMNPKQKHISHTVNLPEYTVQISVCFNVYQCVCVHVRSQVRANIYCTCQYCNF